MSTEQHTALPVSETQGKTQAEASTPDGAQYKRVPKTVEEQTRPIDFRNVPHGHGPCSCCGPYSE